ncbi:unnamed protein product [Triticum aestivum]|uniref:Uncharacterized protein n=1 Tax=Triticum aestivum TaxID=4565 RepID=A0A7H4LEU4_WHEAT|nr:unnamed protein product [Triticum aestivum]
MPQKILLALLVASRKLRHYFQGHPIKVISAYPLERVLRSANTAGRVAEWNIGLQAFDLEFSTTSVIKGASLADFVVEWTDAPELKAALLPAGREGLQQYSRVRRPHSWPQGCGGPGVRRLTIKGKSQLLVNFSNKVYEPKDEHMEATSRRCARWRSSSRVWSYSMCPVAPTRKPTTSPEEHPSGYPKSLASLRSGSSSHQQRHRSHEQRCLEKSSLNHLFQEPRPAARPRECACSWRSNLRRDAGSRNSRNT